MDDEAIRRLIADARNDPAAATARGEFCLGLAAALPRAGLLLQTGGRIIGGDRVSRETPFGYGSDAVVGLATVIEIAGELVAGATALLDKRNLYAAAALVGQLVEVEYLAWAFGSDDDEAKRWLRSSPRERRQSWQPWQLREGASGRFRATDYGYHCEYGGHPTPSALALLRSVQTRQQSAQWWFDLAAHGASIWDYLLIAIDRHDYGNDMPEPDVATQIAALHNQWQETDEIVAAIAAIRASEAAFLGDS